MPSLSLNIGLNNGRKLPFGGGAPSGIPVSAGASVIVTGFTGGNSGFNGTYTNDYISPGGGASQLIADSPTTSVFVKYYSTINNEYKLCFVVQRNQWEIGWNYGDESGSYFDPAAINPSSNQNLVPTTGWSPSITITAA